MLSPAPDFNLRKLKLDDNEFGTEGLKLLAVGLSKNTVLEKLSLNFCAIDSEGAKYLQEILAFTGSKIKKLNLQGNCLKESGVFEIFRALEVNEVLEHINIANNQFSEFTEIPVIDQIATVMGKNSNLGAYELNFNGIYDTG